MIQDAEMPGEEPSRGRAERDRHVGVRCHNQRRFRSPAVTRAFASLIRTSSLGAQSEVSQPDEVRLLEPDVDRSEMGGFVVSTRHTGTHDL